MISRAGLSLFWVFSLVVSIIPLWASAFGGTGVPGQIYFAMLPVVLFVSMLFFLKIYRQREFHIVIVVFLAVLGFRYVVGPYLFVFSKYEKIYPIKAVNEEFLFYAFILMVIEILGSVLICALFLNRWRGGLGFKMKLQKPSWIFLFFIVFLFSLILVDTGSLSRYQLFFAPGKVFIEKQEYSSAAISAIASDMFMVAVPVFIVMFLASKENARSSLVPYLFSLIVVLFFISFFKGVSRFSLLVPALAWLSVMVSAFPSYQNQTKNAVLVYAFLAMVMLTLYKSFGYVEGGLSSDYSIERLALMGNAYFSNLYNLAYALEVGSSVGLLDGFLFWFNDSIANVMFLSKYADSSFVSVNAFNYHVYGVGGKVDQIIPMTGQGVFYFGYLFSPVLVFVSTFLMVLFLIKAQSESHLGLVFVYSYFSLFLSMSMMLSLNSVYPKFINFCLPMLVVFWADKKLSLKKVSLK